jgi:hypothetical protein
VPYKDTLHNLGTALHITRIRQQAYNAANHMYLHNVPLFTLFLLKWIEDNMKIIIFSHQVAYLHSIFHWVQGITTKLQQLPMLHFHASMLTASYLWIVFSTLHFTFYCIIFKTFTTILAYFPFLMKESKLMSSTFRHLNHVTDFHETSY